MSSNDQEKLAQESGSPFGSTALVLALLGNLTALLFLILLFSHNDPHRWDEYLMRIVQCAVAAIACAILGLIVGIVAEKRDEPGKSRREIVPYLTLLSAFEIVVVPFLGAAIKQLMH